MANPARRFRCNSRMAGSSSRAPRSRWRRLEPWRNRSFPTSAVQNVLQPPQLDDAVAATGGECETVRTEGHRVDLAHVGLVESPSGIAGARVPKPQGAVVAAGGATAWVRAMASKVGNFGKPVMRYVSSNDARVFEPCEPCRSPRIKPGLAMRFRAISPAWP